MATNPWLDDDGVWHEEREVSKGRAFAHFAQVRAARACLEGAMREAGFPAHNLRTFQRDAGLDYSCFDRERDERRVYRWPGAAVPRIERRERIIGRCIAYTCVLVLVGCLLGLWWTSRGAP